MHVCICSCQSASSPALLQHLPFVPVGLVPAHLSQVDRAKKKLSTMLGSLFGVSFAGAEKNSKIGIGISH